MSQSDNNGGGIARALLGLAVVGGLALLGTKRNDSPADAMSESDDHTGIAAAQFANRVSGVDPRTLAGIAPQPDLRPAQVWNAQMQAAGWANAGTRTFENR